MPKIEEIEAALDRDATEDLEITIRIPPKLAGVGGIESSIRSILQEAFDRRGQ